MSTAANLRGAVLVALLALGALGPPIVGRELMPPDEPRFALVGRAMYRSGDPVVLHRGGMLYTDKPPLLFWLQAAAFRIAGGTPEWAARLPPLLATLLLVLALESFARRRLGERGAGLRVAAVFVSSSLVIQRGAWVATDALLACATFGAVVLADAWRARRGARLEALAGLALGAGLLAKGPVALVYVLLASLAGRFSGTGLVPLRPFARPAALAVLVLVTLPWVIAFGLREGWSTLAGTLWKQNAQRYLASWDNIEPWWYFGPSLVLGLLPWSLPALGALAGRARRALADEPAARWAAWWVGLALVFFSIPHGKRGVYLLPCWPALALVTERLLARALSGDGPSRRAAAAAAFVFSAVVLGLATAVGLAGRPLPPGLAGLPEVRRGAVALLLLVCLGSLVLGWGLAARRRLAFAGPAGMALGLGLLAPWLFTPALNAAQAARAFGAAARAAIPGSAPVACGRKKWELVEWYGDLGSRLVPRRDLLLSHLEGPPPRAIVITADAAPPLRDCPPGTREALRGRIGRVPLVVLVRGPAAGPPPPEGGP